MNFLDKIVSKLTGRKYFIGVDFSSLGTTDCTVYKDRKGKIIVKSINTRDALVSGGDE